MVKPWILLLLPVVAFSQTNRIDFPSQVKNAPFIDTRTFAYLRTHTTTGNSIVTGDLSAAGAGKVLTFPIPPIGLVASHGSILISGGTGTAEAAPITATTCSGTSYTVPCTATITTANTHTGLWTAQSATLGIQESICAIFQTVISQPNNTVWISAGGNLNANVDSCGHSSAGMVIKPQGVQLFGAFTVLGANISSQTDPIVVNASSVNLYLTGSLSPGQVLFAALAGLATTQGQIYECTDCLMGTDPCLGGGTGAIAIREASAWSCLGAGIFNSDVTVNGNFTANQVTSVSNFFGTTYRITGGAHPGVFVDANRGGNFVNLTSTGSFAASGTVSFNGASSITTPSGVTGLSATLSISCPSTQAVKTLFIATVGGLVTNATATCGVP